MAGRAAQYLRVRRSTVSLARLRTAYGDEVPCNSTIYKWFAKFKPGLVDLSDEFHDGRPSTAVNNKNIGAMRRMIEIDRHVTYHEIRASISIDTSEIKPTQTFVYEKAVGRGEVDRHLNAFNDSQYLSLSLITAMGTVEAGEDANSVCACVGMRMGMRAGTKTENCHTHRRILLVDIRKYIYLPDLGFSGIVAPAATQ
ncbi:Putative uncharacterized protein FLJ37770 [Eumeta japonica]|uniref:Mos1 transposase HTH domain-containing protein n=1 Tax=Eumeta variegata TaxID=151549 RepID=A0A4C1Z4U2_EUMVA|nr:Putative uncharacterized protein FLJ37770 [Eumeta japonica]